MLAGRAEPANGLRRVAKVFGRIGKPSAAAEPAQETLGLASTADSSMRSSQRVPQARGTSHVPPRCWRRSVTLPGVGWPHRPSSSPCPQGASHWSSTVLGPVGAVIEEIAAVAPEHLPVLTPTLEAAGLGGSALTSKCA